MCRFYVNHSVVSKLLDQYEDVRSDQELNSEQVHKYMEDILPRKRDSMGSRDALRAQGVQDLTTVGALVTYLTELDADK